MSQTEQAALPGSRDLISGNFQEARLSESGDGISPCGGRSFPMLNPPEESRIPGFSTGPDHSEWSCPGLDENQPCSSSLLPPHHLASTRPTHQKIKQTNKKTKGLLFQTGISGGFNILSNMQHIFTIPFRYSFSEPVACSLEYLQDENS